MSMLTKVHVHKGQCSWRSLFTKCMAFSYYECMLQWNAFNMCLHSHRHGQFTCWTCTYCLPYSVYMPCQKCGHPPNPKPRAVFLLIKIFQKIKNNPPWDTFAHAHVQYLRARASQKKTAQHLVQIFAKKVQNPAILEKGQVPDGRHGRKNAYF